MKNIILGLTMAVGLSVFASQANAAQISFNFETDSTVADASSLAFESDGLGLTITAGTFSSGSNPSDIDFGPRLVDQDGGGLGADNAPGFGDSEAVDGASGNDVLVFSFSHDVVFESISFSGVDGDDDFTFGSVDGLSFLRVADFIDVIDPTLVSSFATLAEATGSVFGIGAIGSGDNFNITDITVSKVAAVPLPAALPLLAGGLGLMGFMGWRRKKAA